MKKIISIILVLAVVTISFSGVYASEFKTIQRDKLEVNISETVEKIFNDYGIESSDEAVYKIVDSMVVISEEKEHINSSNDSEKSVMLCKSINKDDILIMDYLIINSEEDIKSEIMRTATYKGTAHAYPTFSNVNYTIHTTVSYNWYTIGGTVYLRPYANSFKYTDGDNPVSIYSIKAVSNYRGSAYDGNENYICELEHTINNIKSFPDENVTYTKSEYLPQNRYYMGIQIESGYPAVSNIEVTVSASNGVKRFTAYVKPQI